jgi:hypothetical protein
MVGVTSVYISGRREIERERARKKKKKKARTRRGVRDESKEGEKVV